MLLKIKMITGEYMEFQVTEQSIVVGRSSKCQVVIPFEGVSRQHCLIEFVDGQLFITDLASTNGVIVNGEKIPPSERFPYQTYFPLSFGSIQNLSIDLDPAASKESFIPIIKLDPTNVELQTSTRKMPEKNSVKRKPLAAAATKPDAKAQSRAIMNILVILMFGALVYWYLQNKKASAPEEAQPTFAPGKTKSKESDYF